MTEAVADYLPIDYSRPFAWGSGEILADRLTPLEARIWQLALSRQDKRDDPGQGEVVTYFACELSRLLKLSMPEREVVVLSAILHDTGYSFMPGIAELNRELTQLYFQGKDDPEFARRERPMREEHQKLSVNFARELLGDHSGLKEICAIVGDHDTRIKAASEVGYVMWDADVLWRVTLPAYETLLRRMPSYTEQQAIEDHNRQLTLSSRTLHYPLSRAIGLIESENTMAALSLKR